MQHKFLEARKKHDMLDRRWAKAFIFGTEEVVSKNSGPDTLARKFL
jgi:hypothetical protein